MGVVEGAVLRNGQVHHLGPTHIFRQTYDGKHRQPDRVKKPLDLIPVDLVTDFRFASRIL